MDIALSPAFERFIDAKVASGQYETASEVVREALQLLEKRDQAREQLRTDVQAGFDQLARGDGHVYDKTTGRSLAERIKLGGRSARAKTSSG